jgi:hypothetical protein
MANMSNPQDNTWVEGNLQGPLTAEKVMEQKSCYKGKRDSSVTNEDTFPPVAELHGQ